jgi:hypothetical protein
MFAQRPVFSQQFYITAAGVQNSLVTVVDEARFGASNMWKIHFSVLFGWAKSWQAEKLSFDL